MAQVQLPQPSEESYLKILELESKPSTFSSLTDNLVKACLILPAAGSAERWGGAFTYKELLPVKRSGQTQSLLQHSMNAGMHGAAQTALIISRERKLQHQMGNIESMGNWSGIQPYYTLQPEYLEGLWGAIQCSFSFQADRFYFAMPDTFFPEQIFMSVPPGADFWLGTFETTQPARYGILDAENWISDKGDPNPCGNTYAWGVASWSSRVVEFWKAYEPYDDYAGAFNHAIVYFGLQTTRMEYYYDMANYEEYKMLLRESSVL